MGILSVDKELLEPSSMDKIELLRRISETHWIFDSLCLRGKDNVASHFLPSKI